MEILGEYLQLIWSWLQPWVYSIPTWLVVAVIIFAIIRLAGGAIDFIIKVVVSVFLLSIILRFFGITLPSISEIFDIINGVVSGISNGK